MHLKNADSDRFIMELLGRRHIYNALGYTDVVFPKTMMKARFEVSQQILKDCPK